AAFASADTGARHMLLLLYLCRTWRGEPAALHASALAWVAPGDMARWPMPPADVPLVERLIGLVPPAA
ncbi:MAG: 8-oxo-dGTP diphosphatase, partial [Sphingomonadales bacterium]|nr:8-oxo-dGTP diphosphatase [Sphingomonadales bacterium]